MYQLLFSLKNVLPKNVSYRFSYFLGFTCTYAIFKLVLLAFPNVSYHVLTFELLFPHFKYLATVSLFLASSHHFDTFHFSQILATVLRT